MKKNRKNNSKAGLAWGIILAITFIASLTTSIIFLGNVVNSDNASNNDLLGTTGGILFWVAIGACVGAYFLLANYENCNGKKGVLCMIFYIIVLIPVYTVLFIFIIARKIFEKIVSAPQKPREKTYSDLKKDDYKDYKVTIKDNYGEKDLYWDHNTETWRDSYGNHYITNDEGKTFVKIDY